MEIITSPSNQTVKRIEKLKQKKYREETGEFFIEGYKNVLDTASAMPKSVKVVVFSESAYKMYAKDFSGFFHNVLADGLFEKISQTENSQGVLSINESPKSVFPNNDRCILLDRVRDPGNVGTILRTACACGYSVVLDNCADMLSPKVTRSSMSAILKCEIGVDIGAEELKKAGYELIAADMGEMSVFSCAKPKGKYCIVIGNEADGISEDVKSLCDRVLSVPMEGMESLNAAVAAAVMMYGLRYLT